MNDVLLLISTLIVLACCISAYLRARSWAREAGTAARRSELAAARSIDALRRKAAALRRKAAALRQRTELTDASETYRRGVLAIADDLDRTADRLDPKGPGMNTVSGGAYAKEDQ